MKPLVSRVRSVLSKMLLPRVPEGMVDLAASRIVEPEPLMPAALNSLTLGASQSAPILLDKYGQHGVDSRPVRLFQVNRGIAGSSGMVADAKGRLLRVGDPLERHFFDADQLMSFNPFAVVVRGRTLVCTSRFQHGYFHWLFEILPRILLARKFGVEFDQVYADQRYDYQRQTLEEIGIRANAVVVANMRPCIRAEQLIVFSHWDAFQDYPSWVVRLLREEFLGLAGAARLSKVRPRRVYISRGDSRGRRLLNEDAVLSELQLHGFTRIFSSDYSFAEQVAIFRDAEIVVGVHGAGLANIVFCTPGSAIVEICPPRYVSGCFYHLGSAVGLHYSVVVGDGFDATNDHGWAFQMEDFTVNTKALASAIKDVCA